MADPVQPPQGAAEAKAEAGGPQADPGLQPVHLAHVLLCRNARGAGGLLLRKAQVGEGAKDSTEEPHVPRGGGGGRGEGEAPTVEENPAAHASDLEGEEAHQGGEDIQEQKEQ